MGFRKRNHEKRHCKQCGNEFEAKTYNNKFCNNQCRNDYFNDQKAVAMDAYKNYIAINRGK
jgi:hypothetical protein